MRTKESLIAAALLFCPFCQMTAGPSDKNSQQAPKTADTTASVGPEDRELARRADIRYNEMLGKMQAAVEEIAQLYGNPVFLQVFTNDEERATELKKRLRSARSGEEIQRELTSLEKKRDNLLNDIALKEKEASRLANRLVRQRLALDALATAIEQARKAVEETAR